MIHVKQSRRMLWPLLTLLMIFHWFAESAFSEIGCRSNLTFVSRYIWRGFDTIVDDRPAIQPSFTFDFGKSGVWFNLWSAVALADTDFVELDLVLGYDRPLSEHMSLSAGLGYFTFPAMSGYPDNNSATPEVYVGVTANSLPISPSVTLYYDFNLGDGIYSTLSFSKGFRIGTKVLNTSFSVGYMDQYQDIEVDRGFSDICFGVSTDFGYKSITLSPSINYVIVPNETINDEDEFWVGLLIGWSTDGAD